jgi:hypothetical protein
MTFNVYYCAGRVVDAGVSPASPLQIGSFGIVYVDNELMVAQGARLFLSTQNIGTQKCLVMVLYAKGGGKAGKHAWMEEPCIDINELSYIVIRLYKQADIVRHFSPYRSDYTGLGTIRWRHIPPFSYLPNLWNAFHG